LIACFNPGGYFHVGQPDPALAMGFEIFQAQKSPD
jgi:hypothetical protein